MITAKQANFESKNLKEVKAIEERIEKSICDAIGDGKFRCCISISLNTSNEIRNRIIDDMKELGYKITITNYKDTERGCPVDQCSYYDEISLSWEE